MANDYEQHTLHCNYCGQTFVYNFLEGEYADNWEDALKYDCEAECTKCGCSTRLNESLSEEEANEYGYSY